VSFSHEALFYAGEDDFVARTLPFVQDGLEAGEPVLVALRERNREALSGALGSDACEVTFVDMAAIGGNPARIIPVWQDFVSEQMAADRPFRGIGEPVWPERSAAELVECHRHESLLNMAFDDGPSWRLLCPYDTVALDPETVEAARRTHPRVIENGMAADSAGYVDYGGAGAPLAPAPSDAARLRFSGPSLTAVRAFVTAVAGRVEVDEQRTADLVLAVNELAANSLIHATGEGELRVWVDNGHLVCEIADEGSIADPLAGRRRPSFEAPGGRGLWIVNQLCDLVEMRSSGDGTTIRVRVAR
jgi:anti-sigma regulatory factor (Ser/Thr protein kinase)